LAKLYKFPKKEVIFHFNNILSSSYLNIDERVLLKSSLKSYEELSVGYVDCYLLEYSKKNTAKLFTFDKKLAKK
jgi:predicted nucleic-acid-binding protein